MSSRYSAAAAARFIVTEDIGEDGSGRPISANEMAKLTAIVRRYAPYGLVQLRVAPNHRDAPAGEDLQPPTGFTLEMENMSNVPAYEVKAFSRKSLFSGTTLVRLPDGIKFSEDGAPATLERIAKAFERNRSRLSFPPESGIDFVGVFSPPAYRVSDGWREELYVAVDGNDSHASVNLYKAAVATSELEEKHQPSLADFFLASREAKEAQDASRQARLNVGLLFAQRCLGLDTSSVEEASATSGYALPVLAPSSVYAHTATHIVSGNAYFSNTTPMHGAEHAVVFVENPSHTGIALYRGPPSARGAPFVDRDAHTLFAASKSLYGIASKAPYSTSATEKWQSRVSYFPVNLGERGASTKRDMSFLEAERRLGYDHAWGPDFMRPVCVLQRA